MALVGRFVKADAVGAGGRTHTARLVVRIKVEAANQVDGLIIEVLEVVDGSLLRSATQDAGERRGSAPNRLHPGVVVVAAFET